jgi:hypothetical protein
MKAVKPYRIIDLDEARGWVSRSRLMKRGKRWA